MPGNVGGVLTGGGSEGGVHRPLRFPIRAGFEETRRQGNLTKTGATLAYARQTLVREMYERSTRVYESLREKKFDQEYDIICLQLLNGGEQGRCPSPS